MTMDKSKNREPQMTFQAVTPAVDTHPITRAGHSVAELLEDSGNRRQLINQELSLHLLNDSHFSEQQKLRHVLDWAHSFLSNGSEIHHEFCRADSLILADEEQSDTQNNSPVCKHSSAAKYHHPVSCTAGGNEVLGGEGGSMEVWQLEPSNYENNESNSHLCACKPPFYRESPENMQLQDSTNKQTNRQDMNCRRGSLFMFNQRQCTSSSERNTNQLLALDGATDLIQGSTSCWMFDTARNLKLSYKTAAASTKRNISGLQMEQSKSKVEGKVETKQEVVRKISKVQESSSASVLYAKNNISDSEPEKTHEWMEKTSDLSYTRHLKVPPTLTVYEQYQLCVDRLHHLRIRQSQHVEPGCFMESPAKERTTLEEMAAPVEAPVLLPTSGFELTSSPTNPQTKKHLNKRVEEAKITKEKSSDVIYKNEDRSKYKRNTATITEQGQTKHCVKKTCAAICAESKTHLDLDHNKCGELIKGTDNLINTSMKHLGTASGDNVPAVEESAALTPNPGSFPKRIGCNAEVKCYRSRVKGQKKKAGGRGASLKLCEKSLSSPSKEILQRPQSSGGIKHTKRHIPEDKAKRTAAYRDTPKCLQLTRTHTSLHDDLRPTSPASGECQCEQTDCKYVPAGVPVCDSWLRLPDEVWLSILSLLPQRDLCRVLQVCSRLHTLATDHTLWKDLRVENSNLTEQWLLCASRRRPRSLCLYSCGGPSLTSCGLEMFFTLCRKTLEELQVTSCTGPSLHGDQMLPLIGQLCDHVISVDVSWSGATDTGVKALSDCCAGLQLKSVVLNGCHVTDDPLIKLVKRHKESLYRLEVFGCQFLTPSCLQTVYEMCPGLQHLNIGQVPKVNAQSLTVLTSQLKCLISLNLTGLQAVTDATVDTLLQKCVKLQSLTFSSCPGVTDQTLHSISKYTPCIRSLDVSGCKAVTDAGVQSLALGCRRLQQLDLSSTGTGNRGVTLLANYCSGHLHTVKLSFCHVTSENILKLCRRCKRLKVLHLYGSAHLPTEREIREVNTAVKVYPLA
ncbi:uncharacterized protein LOC127375583 isoform X2 [Dicentrarchus labrax]|uniref:F-box domain-containing protein n=1 Tax=Dicentrarchus labrax TaxID=13489 RepID=A0A8P4G9F4_DICLA|nr:uncharacterized protein LOC127375583 isoform X2 [Dicentrarchus labrax]